MSFSTSLLVTVTSLLLIVISIKEILRRWIEKMMMKEFEFLISQGHPHDLATVGKATEIVKERLLKRINNNFGK